MRHFSIAALYLMFLTCGFPSEQVHKAGHALVTYSGIETAYAEAVGRTADTARSITAEQFGFDMPQMIRITINCDPNRKVRLFNDGDERLYLTVRSTKDLRRPSESGFFHIYGICHEVGHLTMYRILRDHNWLTSDAAEGWAHYIGSRILDGVYAGRKQDLWPDRYDYLSDGTVRLNRQLAAPNPSGLVKAASLWMELADIVGDKGFAEVFERWAQAEIDPANPGTALRKSLPDGGDDSRLRAWRNKAEPVLVFKRPRSGFVARTAEPDDLEGAPMELLRDNGNQVGKRSIAGSGHAVRFEVAGETWYLTTVKIYGSRYGYPTAPEEDFHIWLCDSSFKVISHFPQPYAKFEKGRPKWVSLPVRPTNVPARFIVCVGFDPTGTKGVFVGHDESGTGNSFSGLGGEKGRLFSRGDWLIRAEVDQLKTADALRPLK